MEESLSVADMKHRTEVVSMNKTIRVWGREFELEVIFDVYEGEEVLELQNDALEAFTETSGNILDTCDELKEYCIKRDGDQIGASIENIFKYVIPESLFIKRNEKKRSVVLLCNYKFDEEHGIALFFENEKLTHIGSQDDI